MRWLAEDPDEDRRGEHRAVSGERKEGPRRVRGSVGDEPEGFRRGEGKGEGEAEHGLNIVGRRFSVKEPCLFVSTGFRRLSTGPGGI